MNVRNSKLRVFAIAALAAVLGSVAAYAVTLWTTDYPDPMIAGLEGWTVEPFFTVGETIDVGGPDYTPPGILDGMDVVRINYRAIRAVANHELTASSGYPYTLANGTELTGARVSAFDISQRDRKIGRAQLAYNRIIDRMGKVVTTAEQLNEADDPAIPLEGECVGNEATCGLSRLCGANGVRAGEYGFVNNLFFTGEETDDGQEFALAVKNRTLYALPWMGRAAWESVTPLETGTDDKVALLIGDDRGGAPLLLYVGNKKPGDIPARNGLEDGTLYAWVADSGETTPEEWNGTGSMRTGKFVAIDHYDPSKAGECTGSSCYDKLGFANQSLQDELAAAAGAFRFSRPEDVATNPEDGTQAVLASTGRDSLFPSDSWGTTYIIDVDFGGLAPGSDIPADIEVIYDGDDAGAGAFAGPDFGIRSPDNLEWAFDGYIYLQEDRSIGGFGDDSGREASIWQLDPDFPDSGMIKRIGEMDRSAVAPAGVTDSDPTDLGDWESSGITDVTDMFPTKDGETLLLGNVQAHSLRDGVIASEGLVQGGQLFFMSNISNSVPE